MPDWLVPVIVALGGGTGLGAFIKALFDGKSSATAQAATQLNALVDQLQEVNKEDRTERKELSAKVERVLDLYHIERDHSADLYVWALNGAPPPPPERRKPSTALADPADK